jgi:SM-20-related protein
MVASFLVIGEMDSLHKVPPHGCIRNWLGREAVERLLAYAEANEHLFKDSELAKGLDRTRRISRKLELGGDHKNEIVAKVQESLPVILETLRVKPFIPKFEVELVAHGDGAFFALHYDTITYRRRIISAVYYFHAMPKTFSGGVLRLHSMAAIKQQGTFIDIPPECDTLVFFSSIFPHEVLPIKLPSARFLDSRFAINIWLSQRAED